MTQTRVGSLIGWTTHPQEKEICNEQKNAT